MNERLKFVWNFLLFTVILFSSAIFIPLWVVIWFICGWFFPKEMLNWVDSKYQVKV